jgi:hypothetical protein
MESSEGIPAVADLDSIPKDDDFDLDLFDETEEDEEDIPDFF